MRLNIDNDEVKHILEMHSKMKKNSLIITEQESPPKDIKNDERYIFLKKAEMAKCFGNGKIKQNTSTKEIFFRQNSVQDPSKQVDFFMDYTYKFTDGSKSGKWKCDKLTQIIDADATAQKTAEQSKLAADEIEKRKLDSNHISALEDLKDDGWFHEPAPTDVQVDRGLFEKFNLVSTGETSDPSSQKTTLTPDEINMLKSYQKYFSIDKFPQGFYIYKKINEPLKSVTQVAKTEVSSQSCKDSIENLYNNMMSPLSYRLTDVQLKTNKATANTCAEKANIEKFLLRFGLKDKLDKLKNARILNP